MSDRGTYWLPVDDDDAWVLASVKHRDGALWATRTRAPEGVPLEFQVSEELLSQHTRAEGTSFKPPSDLINLPSIATSTVLHTLRLRHESDQIYTSVGPVVIAVNPFRPTNESSAERIDFLLRADPDTLPPHVFNVARSAYSVMCATGGPQSILISGESGAGKTESAKLCMTCLAQLSASPASVTATALESGLLLESFGNARTVYNDNSSRFGKWVEVRFDKRDCITSCCVRSYLLEISRVVHQAPGERNYHVFNYLLAAKLTPSERDAFGLPAVTDAAEFTYTAASATTQPACGGVGAMLEHDAAGWQDTHRLLSHLGLSGDQEIGIGQLLAAILTLGNIRFEGEVDEPGKVSNALVVSKAARLLGVTPEDLERGLLTKLIVSGRGSMYNKAVEADGAADMRDALAKQLYLHFFEWLVARLNNHMRHLGVAPDTKHASSQRSTTDAAKSKQPGAGHVPEHERFVGLLDIFGFEKFEVNSLEQLCINFANEKLQAQFIEALVASQRAEYEAEGIAGGTIDFPDNSLQLRLLEGKVGVLSLLDEECTLPKGSDESYVDKMHDLFNEQVDCYSKPTRKYVGAERGAAVVPQFLVRHFADAVVYTATGWLEKNKGGMPTMLEQVMGTSISPLMQELFGAGKKKSAAAAVDVTDAPAADAATVRAANFIQAHQRGHVTRKKLLEDTAGPQKKTNTVLGNFRSSLKDLFATLDVTSARYVRCLKPNAAKAPNQFIGKYVERQLSYNGVLAIVEIQAAGFAVSLPKVEFVARYRCCCVPTAAESKALAAFFANPAKEPDAACKVLLLAAQRTLSGGQDVKPGESWLEQGGARLGYTKVFVKEVVLRQLEKARDATAVSSAVSMQKVARRYLARGGIRTFKILKPLAENVRRMGANASDVLAAAADSKLALQRLEDEMAKPGVLSAVEAVDCIDAWMVKSLAELQEVVKKCEAAAAQAAEEAAAKSGHVTAKVASTSEVLKGCDNYRVDMTASRFGDCVCGFAKTEHSEAATVHGAGGVGLSSYDKPTDLRHPKSGGGRAARLAAQRAHINEKMGAQFFACDEYRLDMNAARFGDCKCGYPKTQHSLTSQRVGNEKGGVAQKVRQARASIAAVPE